jgi:alpha-1,2-glucosyltransferase
VSLVALWTLLLAAAAVAYGGIPLGDEYVHQLQVHMFIEGRYTLLPYLTTIPGFHVLVAGIQKLLQTDSVGVSRLVTMAFAVLGALAFAGIRRALAPGEDPRLATLQFVFFPILFPFLFLIYTDVPSLALVLWAFRCSLDRRHVLAGVLGIASLLVRQNNIVWIAFIALLQVLEMGSAYRSWRDWLRACTALWPYVVNAAAFAGFWLWRGSISLSLEQASLHPDLSLRSGNLFFMLFLFGLFFLPLLVVWFPRYARAVPSRPALLLIPVLLGILYVTTFTVDNQHNFTDPEYYLRNGVLALVTGQRWAFVGFGVVAAIAGCAISQVRWRRPGFATLIPVSMLFVSASWLIEQRYYLIPIALLLAFRVPEERRAERVLLACWIPIAAGFLFGMLTEAFFL